MAIRHMAILFCLFLLQLASGHDSDATLTAPAGAVQPQPHATLATPTSWQYGRTLAECNQYMLDHQLATDIGFHVGSRDHARSLIRAHRYVLMSRSTVFSRLLQQNNGIDKDLLPVPSSSDNNSMLQSGGHSMQTIEIPDIDPDVFRELINYVYTANATIDFHNVIPLIYAAKRFEFPNLIRLCQEVLQRKLSVENACLILKKAVDLNETSLINISLEFIGLKAEEILSSDEILHLSREIFTLLISYDDVDANETLVFKACLRWVEAHMPTNILTTINEVEKTEIVRRVFGDLIYRIRFPIMEPKEFAELVENDGLLTCEEKYSIFHYISTSNHMNNNTLKFDHKKRRRSGILDRFDNFIQQNYYGDNLKVMKIQFNVSRSIILKAIGTYGFLNWLSRRDRENLVNATVSVTLSRSSQKYGQREYYEQIMVEVQNYTLNSTKEQKRDHIYEIPIPGAIRLEPNVFYTISVKYSNDYFYFSVSGQNRRGASITNGDVVFTFNGAGTPTNENQGQIPRLYYY